MKGIIKNQGAQFMILAGFIIAVGLVITTIILNSIIFEVNITIGGGSEFSKYDMINLVQITKDEFRSAYNNSSIDSFNRQLDSFNGDISKIYALHGEGIKIGWDTSNWNSNSYTYFTDNGLSGGKTNWTLVENVNNSDITINIIPPLSSSFIINITNATKYWNINFTTPTPGVTIINTQIMNHISPPYSISFINGSNANGNYSINGATMNGKNFTRARDYVLNGTVSFFMSRVRTNLTIPITVPW
ncbi:Uncharacterised protein [uncultured archaeon]|nr:Uncharacterised protein [uncultured archaeon]